MSHVLATLLDVEPQGTDSFRGPVAPEEGGRMFGGQLLAQSLVAGARTAGDDRLVHSLHGYFLRAGDVDKPVDLQVDRVRDGRSFSVRHVIASQDDAEVFRALLSLHVPEPGLEHDPGRLPDVPPPDAVTMTYDDFTRLVQPDEVWYGAARPIDIRYINAPTAPEGEPVTEPQRMWIRIPPALPDDPAIHAAALAYLSDSTVVDHVMLPHGLRWQDSRLTGASLDHAMWFHRPARADEWMLYEQSVRVTGGARGLASAVLLDGQGRTVATCDQEGLMRWSRDA